jgi:hypothetical protein
MDGGRHIILDNTYLIIYVIYTLLLDCYHCFTEVADDIEITFSLQMMVLRVEVWRLIKFPGNIPENIQSALGVAIGIPALSRTVSDFEAQVWHQ